MWAYALTNVVRARRRSATVLIGLSLAVAIVATPVVALDSQVRGLVDRLIAPIPLDYIVQGFLADADPPTSALEAVPGVLGAEPLVLANLRGLGAGIAIPNGTAFAKGGLGFAFVRPTFGRFADRLGVSGDFGVGPGEVAITDRLAAETGLSADETIEFWSLQEVCEGRPPVCTVVNVTHRYVIGSVLDTPLVSTGPDTLWFPTASYGYNATVFAPRANLTSIEEELFLSVDDPPYVSILVWADRVALLDPYNRDATEARVLGLLHRLEEVAFPWELLVRLGFDPSTGTTLASAVERVNDATLFQVGLLVLLSMPATALALVFSRVAFDIGLARRRREIGILRSRGWSARQVFGMLLAEAVVLGALGAVIGMAAAVATSRVFLALATASLPGGFGPSGIDVSVSVLAVSVTMATAIAAAFLVAFPVVRRAASLRIVGALRSIHPLETRVSYALPSSAGLIVLGTIGLALSIGFALPSPTAGGIPFLVDTLRAVVVVTGPVFLVLGVARIVTLGTSRPYRACARLVRPWARDLDFLVAEGLQRNARRSSNLVVVAAFGLGFALFIVGLLGSVEASEIRYARGVVGGDLTFETAAATRPDLEAVRSEAGVAALAVAEFLPSNYGTLIVVDAAAYAQAAGAVDAYYFRAGPSEALPSLGTSGGAIVHEATARSFRLRLGDPLAVTILSGRFTDSFQADVVAIAGDLPGLQPNGDATDPTNRIIVDFATMEANEIVGYPLREPYRRAVIRMEPGGDARALAENLEDRWPGRSVLLEDVLAALRGDPFHASLVGHLYTQAGLAVAVLVVAVGVTVYLTGVERDGEFATVAARGLDGRGLSALLFGEGLVVAILGTLLALFAAFVALAMFLRLQGLSAGTSLGLEPTVPPAAGVLLLGTLATTLAGVFLASIRLRRTDVPRVLKLRGL